MDTKKYRTRQEFVSDTNPKGKDYIIALDVGYSGTKVFYENGHFCFPSYAKKLTKGMINATDERDILYKDDDSDDVYMVGYNAQNMMDSANTNDTDGELFSRKRYSDKRFKIICNVGIALALRGKKDNREIFIQTGLPTSYVEGDSETFKKVISKPAKFSIKRGNGEWVKYELNINRDNIHIIPQPSGTLYSTLIKNDGVYIDNAKEMLCSDILVMDIGFGTFDFYGIKNRSIDCKESTDEVGMREVLSRLSKKIYNATNEDIRVAALQKHLETGKFTCINEEEMSDEEIPIAPFLQEANKEILADAMEKAKSVTNAFRGYKYLIISGGTGAAWLEDIKEWLKNMKSLTIMPGNINDKFPLIYCNARGNYMYRYTLNKR